MIGKGRIEVQDVHGCADEADKELKTLLSQYILPTSQIILMILGMSVEGV